MRRRALPSPSAALTLIHLISIPVTNTSGQPGAQHRGGNFRRLALQQLWLFWVMPIVGGILGGVLYRTLLENAINAFKARVSGLFLSGDSFTRPGDLGSVMGAILIMQGLHRSCFRLFIILLPLVVGYLLPLRHSSALKLINRMLSWIVYVILFMGISAFLDNLASNLLAILHAAVSVVIILLCNIAALLWLESKMPWHSQHRQEKLPSRAMAPNRCSCAVWSCSVFCSV